MIAGQHVDFQWYAERFTDAHEREITFSELHGIDSFSLEKYYTGEVLWFELVRLLTALTGEAAIALRLISFFMLFTWAWLLINRTSYAIALLFLLNPLVIDMALSIMRNGLAFTLFMIALTLRSEITRALLFLIGSFTHSLTLVLVIFYYFLKLISRVKETRYFLWLFGISAAVATGLVMTVGIDFLGTIIEDRRLREDYIQGLGSPIQMVLWSFFLFLQLTSGQAYIRKNIFVISIIAWFLILNVHIPWASRIWVTLSPLIVVSMLALSRDKCRLFLLLYSGYLVRLYMKWSTLLV